MKFRSKVFIPKHGQLEIVREFRLFKHYTNHVKHTIERVYYIFEYTYDLYINDGHNIPDWRMRYNVNLNVNKNNYKSLNLMFKSSDEKDIKVAEGIVYGNVENKHGDVEYLNE